jgi:uncharacterized protein
MSMTNLALALRHLSPVLHDGEYVFVTVADIGSLNPVASICEDEGVSVVLSREVADTQGLVYDYVAAWITLRVNSALSLVGFSAAISDALASANISCNIVSGRHHDHLFVPAVRARAVLELLHRLAASS